MRARIFFWSVAAFWVVMSYLLWRSEVGGHSVFGSALPPASVWEKILTAPDNSKLDIYDHDVKTGFGSWTAGAADSPLLNGRILTSEYHPGVVAAKPSGYSLNFEGSLLYKGTNHVRYLVSFALDTNKVWKEFHFHASTRPRTFDLLASADQQKLFLTVDDGISPWERNWTFAELRDPQALMGEVGGAFALGVLSVNQSLPGVAGQGIQWEAHEDHLKIGGVKMRAYRLDAYILGQKVEIFVSLVGEILQVSLPRSISLRNQAINPIAH
jgi:hypothetical protein